MEVKWTLISTSLFLDFLHIWLDVLILKYVCKFWHLSHQERGWPTLMTMYNQQNITVGQWVTLKAFVRGGYASSAWFPREASFLEEKPSHHVYGPITLNLPHWRDHMQAFCSAVPKNSQPTTGITDSHVYGPSWKATWLSVRWWQHQHPKQELCRQVFAGPQNCGKIEILFSTAEFWISWICSKY